MKIVFILAMSVSYLLQILFLIIKLRYSSSYLISLYKDFSLFQPLYNKTIDSNQPHIQSLMLKIKN